MPPKHAMSGGRHRGDRRGTQTAIGVGGQNRLKSIRVRAVGGDWEPIGEVDARWHEVPGASDQQQLRIGYIEFGSGRVGRVDIDFLSGPTKTGSFTAPFATLVAEKEHFGSSRRVRWFGT